MNNNIYWLDYYHDWLNDDNEIEYHDYRYKYKNCSKQASELAVIPFPSSPSPLPLLPIFIYFYYPPAFRTPQHPPIKYKTTNNNNRSHVVVIVIVTVKYEDWFPSLCFEGTNVIIAAGGRCCLRRRIDLAEPTVVTPHAAYAVKSSESHGDIIVGDTDGFAVGWSCCGRLIWGWYGTNKVKSL